MSERFKSKSSKWGKLLSKSDKGENHFKLNEDVADFLKPSTDRIPGEGTRQLAAPRIDVAVAQRWPSASDVLKVADKASGAGARPRRNKNLTVKFVRTPPDIIGEGGDESEVPVVEVARAKARLSRSKTERRPVAPVLDTLAAEAHRHAKNQPMSAPGQPSHPRHQVQNHRHNQSLAETGTSTYTRHPSQHRFFEPTAPAAPLDPVYDDDDDAPRPGIKRTATTFSNFDEIESSPASEGTMSPTNYDSPQQPQQRQQQTPRIEMDFDFSPTSPITEVPSPPTSPPISLNPELAKFLEESPPQPRSFPAQVQARQTQLRAEEGRAFRRASKLPDGFDENSDPLRPSSPESPRRPTRSGDMHFTEPEPLVVPSISRSHPEDDYSRSASPDQSPPPAIVAPKRPHPLPGLPDQDDTFKKSQIPPIQTQNFDIPYHNHEANLSVDDHRKRPSPELKSASSSASLQPYSNNYPRPQQPSGSHPLPPTPSRGPSPSYFAHQPMNPNGLTPAIPFDSYSRSVSTSSRHTNNVMSPSDNGPEAAEYAAISDFGTRVEHMRGVFRLTAERERPIQTVTSRQWLRAAIWWLHKGRTGLTVYMKSAPRGPDGQRAEMLTQAHVDVAKTWWILTDILGSPDSPQSKIDSPQDTLKRDTEVARSSLRSFALSMTKNNLMPPYQSLIQGQNTTMWVEYPRFASDVASLLRGNASKALVASEDQEEVNPLEALPLGDTRDTFCYSRMFVNASVNTEEADTDRVILPCILTMMRGKSDYQTKIVISSQMDLINMVIKPGDGGFGKGPTWNDVTWKTRLHGIYIRLPRGFTLNIEFSEQDFRALWNMVEYTNKVNVSMKPEADERMIHEARLVELKHTDSSNPHVFGRDRVRSCTALLFEKRLKYHHGAGDTKLHRGYRLLLVTNPNNKTLSATSLSLCRDSPFLFEMSSGHEAPSMTIHTQDSKRHCVSNLVFRSADERQDLLDVLQGISTSSNEQVAASVTLRNLVIETSMGQETIAGAFQGQKWRDLRVISEATEQAGQDAGDMTLSEHFRIVAMHDGGGVTDRLNLGPGELLMRVSASNAPSISLLRRPQEDMTVSMDTRKTYLQGPDALVSLVQAASKTPTIRTLTFPSTTELHLFQKALTRYTVRYDAPASLFAISRRRMVVPIYKKWEATKVRLQVLTLGNITKIAAFFEDFVHADAMVFQIKTTDTFEKAKGDRPAKYCVKFVDAKFSLPKKEKDGEGDEDEPPSDAKVWGKGVRRRFINMEGLEYAGEHDDITIGFETEEERDQFSEVLPAATTTKSMINLKRRI